MAPTATPARSEAITVEYDNVRLAGTLQVPALDAGQRVPLVIVMHGFTGTQNDAVLRATATALAEAGIASIRFDFAGSGASSGHHVDMTIPHEVDDAHAVFNYAAILPFVSSIGLAGHSMGGVVATLLAGQLGDEVSALVLFAPAVLIPDDARSGVFFGNRYDPADPPASVSAFGFPIGRDFLVTAQTLPIQEEAASFAGPVDLIQGRSDALVTVSSTEQFATAFQDAQVEVLDGQDHEFFRDPAQAGTAAANFFTRNLP